MPEMIVVNIALLSLFYQYYFWIREVNVMRKQDTSRITGKMPKELGSDHFYVGNFTLSGQY
jgi:hypothetical protein